MAAKDILKQALKLSVIPEVKKRGFRKSDFSFHRRVSEAMHVINLQLSRGNTSHECRFYVNIGVAFDDLYDLANKVIPEKPKEYECHIRHRMEELEEGVPPHWTVTTKTNIQELDNALSAPLSNVIDKFDNLGSVQDLIIHSWFDIPSDPSLKFTAFYAVGDYEAAWQEVHSVAKRFRDRRGMSEVDLINRYNLDSLKPRLFRSSA